MSRAPTNWRRSIRWRAGSRSPRQALPRSAPRLSRSGRPPARARGAASREEGRGGGGDPVALGDLRDTGCPDHRSGDRGRVSPKPGLHGGGQAGDKRQRRRGCWARWIRRQQPIAGCWFQPGSECARRRAPCRPPARTPAGQRSDPALRRPPPTGSPVLRIQAVSSSASAAVALANAASVALIAYVNGVNDGDGAAQEQLLQEFRAATVRVNRLKSKLKALEGSGASSADVNKARADRDAAELVAGAASDAYKASQASRVSAGRLQVLSPAVAGPERSHQQAPASRLHRPA